MNIQLQWQSCRRKIAAKAAAADVDGPTFLSEMGCPVLTSWRLCPNFTVNALCHCHQKNHFNQFAALARTLKQ